MSPIHAVGADGATGDELVTQAADAAQAVVEAMVAQTYATGQVAGSGWSNSNGWSVAVSVVCERSGDITAWLATSVGPSYIHRGVRVPDDVRLAVTDPVVGRELWDTACAAGGADPLEVLARHAELRDAAAPGSRVLALAASVPEGQVTDWAEVVHARAAVSVDPRIIERAAAGAGEGQHRCAVAMPWEWRQANAFTEEQRLRVAGRHMLMARTAGHLDTPGCLRVIDKFERRTPITDSDWADVDAEFMSALIRAESARGGVSFDSGPANPEWAFKTMCAAEGVQCLRDYHTAEGCADLLYATRLAGAPLQPQEAVA